MTLQAMTNEQNVYLKSLICQRLRDDSKNRNQIKNFFNRRNPYLVRDLHEGWKKDRNGETAYYVVKDPASQTILLYFSLRCGSLHTPDPYRRIQAEFKKTKALYDAARGKNYAPKWAQEQIEVYKANGIPSYVLIPQLEAMLDGQKETLKDLKRDAKDDPSQMTVQTGKNFSGVEMVHFCKNDQATGIWENTCVGNIPLGETLFWHFILPVIQETAKLVGCQYVYLFAADGSEDQSLVTYYLEKLHFEIPEGLSSHKPTYDVYCMPMCRALSELERYQKDNIKNFNRPTAPKKKTE